MFGSYFRTLKDVFCRDKHVFVATKVSLSRQTFCRDKIMFVATNILLSRQKTSFVFAAEKNFVVTIIIFVAALAKDRLGKSTMIF